MDTISQSEQNKIAIHPMQSWEWGEARKKIGIHVEKIVEDQSLFQFTVHSIPYSPFSIGYLPRSVLPTNNVLKNLFEFGKKNKLIFIKIEPYIYYDESYKLLTTNYTLLKSPHALFPEWTQTLELIHSEEILLQNMKPKTRYNIHLAQKKGVVIKEMSTDEGYLIFERLYFETCKRQKYRGHTPLYHKSIWSCLKNSQAHILIAFLGKTPLAAYELLYFQKRIYYLYGGSSVQNKNVMAPNLLMWEAIKLGKRLGATLFDMWGSLPPTYSNSHSWSGFTRFKEGYGTQFTHLSPSYDLVIYPLLYKVYTIANKLREKIL